MPKPAREAPDPQFRSDSHADLTVAVAELGVSMLYVEKAMASSMARADEIRDAVRARGTVFNTGVLRRFDNRYDIVREAILAGHIGEPRVVVHYAASSLMHGHIHSIDTVSWLLGDPTITHVRGELLPRNTVVEDNFLASDPNATYQLRFDGGIEAWSVPGAYWEFEVLGSEGAVRSVNNGAGAPGLRLATDGRTWEEHKLAAAEPYSTTQFCLEDLVRGFEDKVPTRGHIDVTHHITEVCLAVAQSHRDGGVWVELPGVDSDLYVFHV